jgi:hypothetical protein
MRADLERFAGGRANLEPGREWEPFQFALTIRSRFAAASTAWTARAAKPMSWITYSKRASDYAKDVNRPRSAYLLAVEKVSVEPGKMSYCGLRGAVQFVVQQVTANGWRRCRSHLAHRRRSSEGRREPRPASLEPCRYCTFGCLRYQPAAAA